MGKDHDQGTKKHRGAASTPFASHYAPGQERPLVAYALLAGIYASTVGGSLTIMLRRGHELPERFNAADLLLIGVATHKISRLVTKDRVTAFVRAPFTRFQRASGHGEVEEEAYGDGLRRATGELLVCPYCIAMWVATGLTIGLVGAPRQTRLLSTIFVAHTVSDFLQVAYHAAETGA